MIHIEDEIEVNGIEEENVDELNGLPLNDVEVEVMHLICSLLSTLSSPHSTP